MKNILIKSCLLIIITVIFLGITLDKIVAVVNNRAILQSEIKKGIDFIERSPFFPPESKDSLKSIYEKNFIDEIVLEQIAKSDSIVIDSYALIQEVNTKISEMINSSFSDSQAFNEFLNTSNISYEELRTFYYFQIKSSFLKQQIILKKGIVINITPSQMKKFYEENKDSFNIPLSADIYHIAFIIQPDSSAYISYMQKIDALVNILKSGKSFDNVAKEYSDDEKSKNNGGIIGYISFSDISPDIANFLYTFKNSDTLIYTQSREGFHIIKILGQKADSIKYQQILIGFELTSEDSLRAYNKAQMVYAEIKNKNMEFEEAAKKYSEDYSTSMNGGYIGRVPIESLQENIKNVLKNLDNEEVSNIIKSDFGYEIFMIKNKEGGYLTKYLDAANIIKMILENRELEQEINKIIEKEKSKMFIKYINE